MLISILNTRVVAVVMGIRNACADSEDTYWVAVPSLEINLGGMVEREES